MAIQPTPAGKRNCRLVIQRPLGTVDAAGNALPDFESVLSVWAEKLSLNAREFLAAKSVQAEIAGTLKFPACSALAAIDHRWRAVELATGRVLNFVAPFDADHANAELKVMFTVAGVIDPGPLVAIDDVGAVLLADEFGVNFVPLGAA